MTNQIERQTEFRWQPQPEVAAVVWPIIKRYVASEPTIASLAGRMLNETGTRLIDWIDHIAISAESPEVAALREVGFIEIETATGQSPAMAYQQGIFPPFVLQRENMTAIGIAVDRIEDYLAAHDLVDKTPINGPAGAALRTARVGGGDHCQLWIVERHGTRDCRPNGDPPPDMLEEHRRAFFKRERDCTTDAAGFAQAAEAVKAAVSDLGTGRACDLFFEAERSYWQSRNRAAGVQRRRQDALGLGWANHDHHTYRSSRECFVLLISLLELLGFHCRERFYAGREAGWGAQVLEQSEAGIVVFADVDMLPEEVSEDFAHEAMAEGDQLGTVGLWCGLHGESFLQAGMHHLECQFDFDAAREQLRTEGIQMMAPFTDFDCLRQAFTEGEIWPVAERRLVTMLEYDAIQPEQAVRIRTEGALGSHLEILERNDGYKGFNQRGISDIIMRTDPRNP